MKQTLTLEPATNPEEKDRLADITQANGAIVDYVKGEGFSEKQIAGMTPRELFGHVCIANGICTADNGMTLFDVAEQLLAMKSQPVQVKALPKPETS